MKGHVFHRRLGHDYPTVDRGEGAYLYDTAGRRYLDAAGGALVANIGHGVAEIAEVLAEQARRVAFAHGTQFTSRALEEYAAALGEVSPIPGPWVYLVSGGSEVVETALKLARQVWVARGEPGRHKFIARWSSYHGATLGALSASGRTGLRRPYAPLLADVAHIPPAYCYRCPFGQEVVACDLACAEALEAEILRQGSDTVAAFIGEPVVGATLAAAIPPPGYWPRVREICDRYGVLLVADEVMTGFGRTGRWFAVEHSGVVPDVLVTAKGASGGYYPLGVLLARKELVAAIRNGPGDFTHGFTYANGVLAAAVGLAVLRYLQAHDLVAASARQGRVLLDRLDALRALPAVGDVRGLGLMAGLELVADRQSKRPFPRGKRVAERVQAAALAEGVNVYYGTGLANGAEGDAILIGPPFIVSEEQIDEIVRALWVAITALTG
jgi:adenosylmethionine-8-amino-7-oxononanoate aminotransferase